MATNEDPTVQDLLDSGFILFDPAAGIDQL